MKNKKPVRKSTKKAARQPVRDSIDSPVEPAAPARRETYGQPVPSDGYSGGGFDPRFLSSDFRYDG